MFQLYVHRITSTRYFGFLPCDKIFILTSATFSTKRSLSFLRNRRSFSVCKHERGVSFSRQALKERITQFATQSQRRQYFHCRKLQISQVQPIYLQHCRPAEDCMIADISLSGNRRAICLALQWCDIRIPEH